MVIGLCGVAPPAWSSTPEHDLAVVTVATERSLRAGTFRFVLTDEVPVPGTSEVEVHRSRGRLNLRRGQLEMQTTSTDGQGRAETTTERIVGGRLYVQYPKRLRRLSHGKPWAVRSVIDGNLSGPNLVLDAVSGVTHAEALGDDRSNHTTIYRVDVAPYAPLHGGFTTARVAIDGHGYVRRVGYDTPPGDSDVHHYLLEISGYGTRVSVSAPSRSEVG